MRWLALVLSACAMSAPERPADPPANPRAPVGRLAGAPPALRPGAVKYDDVPALRSAPAPMHHHHGM